jgi:hypothetical protein
MKLSLAVTTLALASVGLAAPVEERATGSTYTSGATANDVTNGVCSWTIDDCTRLAVVTDRF